MHYMDQYDEWGQSTALDLKIIDLRKKKVRVGCNESSEANLETLHELGVALSERFGHTGNLSDIEQAITNQQQVVLLTPDWHENKPMYMSNLGLSFQRRFGRGGELSDLEQAISNQQ